MRSGSHPLRVLHVIPSVAARYGGPSAAVIGMSRALSAEGVDVTIATTDADGEGRLAVELGTPTTYEGIPTIFFRREMGEAFKWARGLSVWLRQHVTEFDVVHIHAVFSHASMAAGRACWHAQVPYLVRPLGTLDPWSLRQKHWQKQMLLRLGARSLLMRAAAIHYTAAEEQRLTESQFSSLPRGVVVPVGFDESIFQAVAGADDREPCVLALSRIDPKKRLEWVIDAWHQFAGDGSLSAWRLVIAGDGEPAYVARLRELADGGPARDRIRFAGWVSGAEKVALICHASLFVLPSHQENLGVALVEAMAAGVPPIVTPGVNLGREIDAAQAGWLVSERQAAFSEALRAAMEADGERLARGGRARVFAQRFRWPVIGPQLVQVYGGLTRSAAPIENMGATPQSPRGAATIARH